MRGKTQDRTQGSGPADIDIGIPPAAVWNAELRTWELCERDEQGQRQGECRWLREDGTVLEVGHYEGDVRTGPFVAYHPNGQVARRGLFAAGAVHGTVLAYASDAPTTEVLRACCVPATAWELRALYANGQLVREVFHDREGRPLLDDGALRPDPPPGVPADAEWDEPQRRWVTGGTDESGNRIGRFRSWMPDGHLVEENQYRDGLMIFTRAYATDADDGKHGDAPQIVHECHFDGDSQPHGAYRHRFGSDENLYADPRIREERGTFDRGRRVGSWTLLDDTGIVIATAEFGVALDEDRAEQSPAFDAARGDSGPGRSENVWWDLATQLRGENRVREALCAAARGAARQADADRLLAFLSQNKLALAPAVRRQRGDEIAASSTETLTSALEALVTGTDAAAVFRTLASVLDSAHPAALDFVDASLLLAPDRRMTHLTRALIRIEQGDQPGALADADALFTLAPDAAASLRAHVRIAFPDFTPEAAFWPTREPLDDGDSGQENEGQVPAQSLPTIQHMIQVYATRLQRLRAAVRERVGPRAPAPDPPWIPPDTSALLPDGPVELRHLTIPAVDVDGEGDADRDPDQEEPDIQIDEEFALDDLDRHSVADLLTTARANWSAVCWLCWACGLRRVALPSELRPPSPERLGTTIACAIARCFRAHDRVITGGVRALAQGLPGFVWEHMNIDQMPNHFARVAAAEYLEIRSMFLWLILPDAVSPFQNDLREA